MTSLNDCVVLDDRELEMIAGGAAVSAAAAVAARRQEGSRGSFELPPSIGLPRTELQESAGPCYIPARRRGRCA
jgi:hypothetical protein